jgi:hypothetical protein
MFTVRTDYVNVGFNWETIERYCVLEDGQPVSGLTGCVSYNRTQAYADLRNDGTDHDAAILWVCVHVRASA